MTKYNMSNIMSRAWELKRNNIRLVGKTCTDYNKLNYRTFGDCLRQAWIEAKNEIKAAAIAAVKAAKEAERAAKTFAGYVAINSVDGDITVDVLFGRVYGKTYGWRKTLKQFGAIWCPEDKQWALPAEKVQDFCRKYAA